MSALELFPAYLHLGLKGLYRGAVPNAQRAAVVNGVQIPTYDVTKRNLLSLGFEVWENNNIFTTIYTSKSSYFQDISHHCNVERLLIISSN